jgi:plasmid segregation protein ParM
MGVVVGLDIGYSNLKVVVGEHGRPPRVLVRPAGAGPVERLGEQLANRGGADPLAPIQVDIDGQRWVAGVAPSRLEGWARPLHADYSATPVYEALAKAALVLAGERSIDRLVTGLPVSQMQDQARKERLRQILCGVHETAFGRIEVGEVQILAQPIGTFVDTLWSGSADLDQVERMVGSTVVVLDVGFYSVDWAVIVQNAVRRDASGTSLDAMSVLIEGAAKRIATDYGGRPQPLAVEAALREGRNWMLVLGERVPLQRFIDQAAREACPPALEAMRQALRRENTNVDFIVVTGGGGNLYAAGIAQLFPDAKVRSAADPVGANARGFFRYGCR